MLIVLDFCISRQVVENIWVRNYKNRPFRFAPQQ